MSDFWEQDEAVDNSVWEQDTPVDTGGQRIPEDHTSATSGAYTTRPTESTGEGLGTSFAGNVLGALEVIDRPRSSIAGGITAAIQGEDILPAMGKGIRGEEHKLMGDLIFEKLSESQDKYSGAKPSMKKLLKKPRFATAPSLANAVRSQLNKNPIETTAALSTIAGLALDIAVDPITYTGVGVTKKGRVLEIADSLQKEGKDITDPKMAKYLKKIVDKGEAFQPTLAGKFSEGQRRLYVAGIPVPNIVTGKALSMTGKVAEKLKATQLGDDMWQMFSSKHGLTKATEGFADLEERFKNVTAMARYHSVKDNKELAKNIVNLSKKLDVPVAEVKKFITEGIERGGVGNIRLRDMHPDVVKHLQENPAVGKSIDDLGKRNKEQLILEKEAGIRVADLGTADRHLLNRMEESIMFAERAGETLVKNPVTGKMKSLAGMKKDRNIIANSVKEAEDISYFKHAITPQAKKAVIKAKKGGVKSVSGGRVFSADHASTLARRFKGMSINEINDAARKGTLKGYEGTKFKDGFFYDDPAIAQTIRDIHHRKAMAVVDLIDDTKKRFGVNVDDLKTKYGKGKSAEDVLELGGKYGYRQVQNPKLQALTKGHAFPDEIAGRLETHYDSFANPEITNAFLSKLYDPVQSWWKAYTLGIFPSYHFRNAAGNLWNNFVTGTNSVVPYAHATAIQTGGSLPKKMLNKLPDSVRKAIAEGGIKTIDGRFIKYSEIADHLDELGVHNRGFIATDIEQAIKTELGGAKWLSLSKEAKAIHIGRKVGTALENNARIGKFIDELQKGKGTFDAAQEVKRVLFDYDDLAKFEKKVMKRLMPFYTWSRKNIPLQVAEMVKNPAKYKAVDTLRMNIENTSAEPSDPNEYVLHDWMLSAYPTRVGWKDVPMPDGSTKKMPEYFMLGGWMPAADVWKLASQPQQVVLDLLSPLLKAPAEFMSDTDFFNWSEIDQDVQSDFLGMRVGGHVKKALSNIRLLTTADMLAKNLGIYEKYKPLMPSPEKEMTPDETWLSFLTGIKTYAVDLEKERNRALGKFEGIDSVIEKKISRQHFKGATDQDTDRLIDKVWKDREEKKLEKFLKGIEK